MTGHRRVFLLLLALGATQAEAQERAAQANRRRLVVPVKADQAAYVPEVRVAPGLATTLHLPRPVRHGGLTLDGEARGRVKATHIFPTDIVLSPSTELGPEQISLTVTTEEGRRYPFLLTTRPGIWDSEVTLALDQSSSTTQETDGSIMKALLDDEKLELRVRHYDQPPPAVDQPEIGTADFFVKTAVRRGNLIFIQVKSLEPKPFAVQEARLEGPNGEVLTVLDIRWGAHSQNTNVNVIVAEVPRRAEGDYTLTSIQLTSRDGNVTTLNGEVSLP